MEGKECISSEQANHFFYGHRISEIIYETSSFIEPFTKMDRTCICASTLERFRSLKL